jgi:predicted transcriptional regulator
MLKVKSFANIITQQIYETIRKEKFITSSKLFIKLPYAQRTINNRLKLLSGLGYIKSRKEKNRILYSSIE